MLTVLEILIETVTLKVHYEFFKIYINKNIVIV